MVLLPDKFWENYELLFGVRLSADRAVSVLQRLRQFRRRGPAAGVGHPGGKLEDGPRPQLPQQSHRLLDHQGRGRPGRRRAPRGGRGRRNLVVVTDDAYFGLFYGDDLLKESLFARLAGLHERILAVKVDGPTKEEYVWGLRTGMLTFAAAPSSATTPCTRRWKRRPPAPSAAPSRTARTSASRSSSRPWPGTKSSSSVRRRRRFSNCGPPRPRDPQPAGIRQVLGTLSLQRRLLHVPEAQGLDAETYRKHLLGKYGVGVIADGERDIRVAFSAVDADRLEDLQRDGDGGERLAGKRRRWRGRMGPGFGFLPSGGEWVQSRCFVCRS